MEFGSRLLQIKSCSRAWPGEIAGEFYPLVFVDLRSQPQKTSLPAASILFVCLNRGALKTIGMYMIYSLYS